MNSAKPAQAGTTLPRNLFPPPQKLNPTTNEERHSQHQRQKLPAARPAEKGSAHQQNAPNGHEEGTNKGKRGRNSNSQNKLNGRKKSPEEKRETTKVPFQPRNDPAEGGAQQTLIRWPGSSIS